jgi:hypothetical protein
MCRITQWATRSAVVRSPNRDSVSSDWAHAVAVDGMEAVVEVLGHNPVLEEVLAVVLPVPAP